MSGDVCGSPDKSGSYNGVYFPIDYLDSNIIADEDVGAPTSGTQLADHHTRLKETSIQPTRKAQNAVHCFIYSKIYGTHMAIKDIKGFSDKAKADAELKAKLIACQKVRELLTLAKENGFNFIEDEMYPPNEPQFTADQLSEKMAKALLRA